MTEAAALSIGQNATWHSHKGIPVRNLWTLLVYASGIARFLDPTDGSLDDDAQLTDVLARLLTVTVERRLRRSLSRGYRPREEPLTRVRGRIVWLSTEAGQLLQRGQVACRFEDLTFDTTRNRLVRSALEAMQTRVKNAEIADRCQQLSRTLREAGVSAGRPTRAEMSRDQIARHDAEDRLMVTAAELALDTVLPAEAEGDTRLTKLDHDEFLLRRIFEKAVAGLYLHELHNRDGWRVRPQANLEWQMKAPTKGLPAILPSMSADLILEKHARRIVLDTKFTGILTPRQHGGEALKSQHLYQLYAYLQSQAGCGSVEADNAEGILLHPSLDRHVDEAVTIQGHRIRFVTIDLTLPADELRRSLLQIVTEH